MAADIHASAIVGPDVTLGDDVRIGPFCVLEGQVHIGDGVELKSHVSIAGHTKVGAGTRIFPFASIGHEPQDQKFGGEVSYLEIGENCVVREHVTMNPGTESGGLHTRVGDRTLVMIGTHIAHDCQIGSDCILVNNVTLGGHVEIGDWAIVGGMTAVHQFVKVGRHAMIGGASALGGDVIPYGLARGNLAVLDGLNLIGLRRRNFSRDQIQTLRRAYRFLFGPEGTMEEKLVDAEKLFSGEEGVSEVLEFVRESGSRGLCTPALDAA
ncbi:acyl-ACP--UDP-N-acetylglucosamine O-acyltransferase [Minwuia sp.]|uniref:acyl-ACP--UDP-N-acetylglucosamine O-acyltransferase n=1 Tax=Minwuia sp. TaxID=2493630 RepID=UPI003A8D4CE2